MVGYLDDLDKTPIGRGAGHRQTRRLDPLAQHVVDLVAVAVALVGDRLAVDLSRARARVQLDRVGTETHRAAEIGDLLLLRQQIDDGERRLGIAFGRVRALHAADAAGELADRHVHAEADAEIGHTVLAREPCRRDLALEAAAAEAAGDQHAVAAGKPLGYRVTQLRTVVEQRLRVDPVDLDPTAVQEARVA